MSCFVNDLVEWSKIWRKIDWEGLARTSSNIKDGALKAHQSYSMVFAYRIIPSIKYVKLISSFYCNCDTVTAKTTVFDHGLARKHRSTAVLLFSVAVYLEKLIKSSLFSEPKGDKGVKYTVNIFIKHWLQCWEDGFLYTGFPIQTMKLTCKKECVATRVQIPVSAESRSRKQPNSKWWL